MGPDITSPLSRYGTLWPTRLDLALACRGTSYGLDHMFHPHRERQQLVEVEKLKKRLDILKHITVSDCELELSVRAHSEGVSSRQLPSWCSGMWDG